jgi:uncharacterized protein
MIHRDFRSHHIKLGARWTDDVLTERCKKAIDEGLIDYLEVNYPIGKPEEPEVMGLPIYVHTPFNALCSAAGIDHSVASLVRKMANKLESPWVGEHLGLLGYTQQGALGYVINPLYSHEFAEVSIDNIKNLKKYYRRPIAIEFGPTYSVNGDYESELHFMADVSQRANCFIIFDICHWMISNINLKRPRDYGLNVLDPKRVIEFHVAGFRKGRSSHFVYDDHNSSPHPYLYKMLPKILRRFSMVQAITLEHYGLDAEAEFLRILRKLKRIIQ